MGRVKEVNLVLDTYGNYLGMEKGLKFNPQTQR